jgi:hypothetical protein
VLLLPSSVTSHVRPPYGAEASSGVREVSFHLERCSFGMPATQGHDPSSRQISAVGRAAVTAVTLPLRAVLAAGGLAALLALGPAIAWDLTSQPPLATPPSPWPQPSPWKDAKSQMSESAKAVAQVYLPPERAQPDAPKTVVSTGASAASAVPSAIRPPRPRITSFAFR